MKFYLQKRFTLQNKIRESARKFRQEVDAVFGTKPFFHKCCCFLKGLLFPQKVVSFLRGCCFLKQLLSFLNGAVVFQKAVASFKHVSSERLLFSNTAVVFQTRTNNRIMKETASNIGLVSCHESFVFVGSPLIS